MLLQLLVLKRCAVKLNLSTKTTYSKAYKLNYLATYLQRPFIAVNYSKGRVDDRNINRLDLSVCRASTMFVKNYETEQQLCWKRAVLALQCAQAGVRKSTLGSRSVHVQGSYNAAADAALSVLRLLLLL